MYWMNHCHLCSLPRDLRQEDYVFTSVCLFVCLSKGLPKD